jgi:hypothetical protein
MTMKLAAAFAVLALVARSFGARGFCQSTPTNRSIATIAFSRWYCS